MKQRVAQKSATIVPSARPSSDLVQYALDWLFEQPEITAYDRRQGLLKTATERAAASRQEE
ncbi:MAG TPA: hypothetical protein VD969_19775 [Symbiobacteriaceae bacterium]|nr:hypothetical protein [Symbiobacteriaceae bacterium]